MRPSSSSSPSARRRRPGPTIRLIGASVAIAAVVAACGASDDDAQGASPTTTAAAASSREPAATRTSGSPDATPAPDTTVGEAIPVAGGDLRVTFADDDGCRDPNQSSRHESRIIARHVLDTLTDQDPETGEIVPWIAESWEVNEDASEYTFTLRPDVTFSDGSAFDAAAVKKAFDGIVALGAKSVLGYSYLSAHYVSSEVVDDLVVKVTFDQPNAQFLQATSSPTLGIASPASYDLTPEQRCAGEFSGSGAFVQENYTQGVQVKLVRRDDYDWNSTAFEHTGPAYVDSITFDFIPEVGVRVGEFLQGKTDIDNARRPSATQTQYSDIEIDRITDAGGTIVRRGIPGVAVYTPNVHRWPFSEPEVRLAFLHAIDRETFARTLNDSAATPATGILASVTPGYIDYTDETALDLGEVERLFTEAGWVRNGDGFWTKDGRQLDIVLNVTATGVDGDLLQAQLKTAGFNLLRNVVTQAQATDLNKAGEWDLSNAVVTRADADLLRNYFDPSVGNIIAELSVPDDLKPEIEALFAESLALTDADARYAKLAEVQDVLIENGLVAPSSNRELTGALAPRVNGFEWSAESFFDLHGVWLSDE